MTVLFNLFTELFCAKTVVFCGNWKNCERGLRWSVHRRKPTLSPHQGPVPGDQFSMMWNIKDCTTFLRPFDVSFLLSSLPYPVCFVLKCKHAEMHSPWHSGVSVYYHTTDATMHSDSERRMVWTPDQALVNSCKSVRSPTLSCCWSFPTKMTVSDANHIDILKMFLCTSEWNEDHLVSIWVVCSSSELKIQNSTAQCNGQRGPEISYFLR